MILILVCQGCFFFFVMAKVMTVHITTQLYISPEKMESGRCEMGSAIFQLLILVSSITYKGQVEQPGTEVFQCVPVFGVVEAARSLLLLIITKLCAPF